MDGVNNVEDGGYLLRGWRISYHDGDSSLFFQEEAFLEK